MGTLLASALDHDDATGVFDKAEDKQRVEIFIDNPMVKPRSVSYLPTMIICGNCAGEDRLPRKTFLAADSTCATCGGRSYVLASKLFQPQRGKEPNAE